MYLYLKLTSCVIIVKQYNLPSLLSCKINIIIYCLYYYYKKKKVPNEVLKTSRYEEMDAYSFSYSYPVSLNPITCVCHRVLFVIQLLSYLS